VDFVNYNSRHVELPPGCKDLIDVLKQARPESPGYPKLPSGAQPEQMQVGKIGELADDMTWLISESIKPSFLAILVPGFPLELRCETDAGPLYLYLAVPSGELRRAERVRAFFDARDRKPLQDSTELDGWRFMRFMRYNLPCVVGTVSDLVGALLREVYDVRDDTPLRFVYGRQPGGAW
jgi:hypothetical protein